MRIPNSNVWEPAAAEESAAPFLVRNHYLLLTLFVCLAATVAFVPRFDGLSPEGQRSLGVFVLCALLWVSGLIPLQITSMLAIILLPLLGIMPREMAFSLFGNTAVFFILGAFILSAVLVECGLSTRISCAALRTFGKSPQGLRLTILLFSAFASFWMSEHAVAAMMFPLVHRMVGAMNLKPQRSRFGMSMYFALAWGCVVGGIATYLGGARNPLAVGILYAETGLQISFLRWLGFSFPMVVMLLLCAWAILRFCFPVEPIDMPAARAILETERRELGAVQQREIRVGIVTAVTVICWITLHQAVGLATIALLAVAAMFILRLTRWEVIERNVNWGIILMYGGAIALGTALSRSGASEYVVYQLLGSVTLSRPLLLILLGVLSLVLTEFISNAAVVSIMLPVAIGLANIHGIAPEAVTLAVALPSGLTYILPMGTPATAIAYSSGFMTSRHFVRYGSLMAIASIVVFALVSTFLWPRLGL
jgi:sodium-dependent dicarboxylate transporter 2/3/5